jgi:hypothetical protein
LTIPDKVESVFARSLAFQAQTDSGVLLDTQGYVGRIVVWRPHQVTLGGVYFQGGIHLRPVQSQFVHQEVAYLRSQPGFAGCEGFLRDSFLVRLFPGPSKTLLLGHLFEFAKCVALHFFPPLWFVGRD